MTSRSEVLNGWGLNRLQTWPGRYKELNINASTEFPLFPTELDANLRIDPNVQKNTIFMAFCFADSAANLITNEAMDPFGKSQSLSIVH